MNWRTLQIGLDLHLKLKKEIIILIPVTEEFTQDENFLKIIDKNHLQLKRSVWCHICFENGSKNWILSTDAHRIQKELETNGKVLTVSLDYATD